MSGSKHKQKENAVDSRMKTVLHNHIDARTCPLAPWRFCIHSGTRRMQQIFMLRLAFPESITAPPTASKRCKLCRHGQTISLDCGWMLRHIYQRLCTPPAMTSALHIATLTHFLRSAIGLRSSAQNANSRKLIPLSPIKWTARSASSAPSRATPSVFHQKAVQTNSTNA